MSRATPAKPAPPSAVRGEASLDLAGEGEQIVGDELRLLEGGPVTSAGHDREASDGEEALGEFPWRGADVVGEDREGGRRLDAG